LSNGNNWLDAGGGNDYIQAGIGNNSIFGGVGNDTIFGGGGSNFINLESGNDFVIAQGGNNTIIGGTGNDTISSGDMGPGWATSEASANNYIYGGAGNSVILGSGGNDTLIGGTGNASIYGGNGSEYIVGGDGNVSIVGGNGNDTIYAGGNGNDTIFAGDGNTTIYGGGGTDILVAGAGTDLILAGDGGTAAAPTMLYAGSGTSTLAGGAGTDQFFGGTGSDTLIAGTGNSTLQGGSGTEVMYASTGTSTLIAGSGSDTLYGGDGNATLQGGSGTTLMVAGGGANTFIGGSGQNTYEVDPGFGNITIQPGSPGDTLLFGSGIALADISVTANVTDAGQSVLVIDVATGGSISIVGGLTDSLDQFNVGGATYTLQQLLQAASTNSSDSAGATGDLIFSAYAGDTLAGTGGNDTIAAYGANTTLAGGGGDTTFIVTDTSQVVSETNVSIVDTIQSSVSYVLPANVRNLTLYGQADLVATGNDLANVLTANNANDTLIAGSGAATMVGGTGYGTFVVNNAADVVQAQANAASNIVQSSVSYVVPENVQTLILTGSGDLIGTGNDQANTIQANNGNDTLIAGTGIVTLVGGMGNDTFVINNAADVVQAQSGGINTIQTSVSYVAPDNVQNLTGTGNADLRLDGNSQANTIITANAGNDTLRGGTGSGTLVGGSGQDTFVLATVGNYTAEKAASTNATAQLDPGLDFTDVSAVQLGNDLLLQVGGTASSLRLQNYFLDPQAWAIEDALGNTTTAQALLDATALESANKLSQLEHQFLTQVKAGYIHNLINQGYSQQADGSWSIAPSMSGSISAQYVVYDGYIATQKWDLSTGILSYSTPTPLQSTSWSSSNVSYFGQAATIQQITTNATDQVINANAGGTLWTDNAEWFKVNWNYSLGLPSGTYTYGSPPIASSGPVGGVSIPFGTSTYIDNNGNIIWPVQWGTNTFYSVSGTLDGGFPGAMLSSPGYLTTQGPFPQAIAGTYYHLQTTDVIQQINVGAGDHTVYGAYSSYIGPYGSPATLVNSGSGNNTIYSAGFVDAGTGNDTIYGAGTVYSESGNDYIYQASTVYGGSGNDTIIRATTVITGTGNDTIFGAGPGTITINPGINGIDLIGNSGGDDLDAEFLDAYYQAQGVSDGAERYRYAGLYDVAIPQGEGTDGVWGDFGYSDAQNAMQLFSMYGGPAAPTTLQQAIDQGWLTYINPLPYLVDLRDRGDFGDGGIWPSSYYETSGTPVTATIGANDFAALAPAFDSGALPAETINFGPGITLSNLQFSWGMVTTDEGGNVPLGTYATLSMTWAQNQGIEVIMPHQDDPIGSGVQEFVFADGTTKSMADMIALASPAPTLDPEIFTFQQGMGQQTLPTYAQQVAFAAGINLSDLRLSFNGTDLVLADQGGVDSLTIPNGAADPDIIYNLPFSFADGSRLEYNANGQGDSTFDQYGSQGNWMGDIWVANDGTYGSDTHNADGSRTSRIYDTLGDATTLQYDTQGNYISDQWVRANGSQGTDSYDVVTGQASGTATLASGSAIVWNTTPPGGGNLLMTTSPGDTLSGGTGADSLFGFANNDTLTAGSGGNYVYGSGNGDVLVSGAGNDLLVGTGNNDTFVINPGSGVDTIIAAGANDTLVFGPGITSSMLTLGLGSLLIRDGIAGDAIHIEGFDPTNALNTGSIQTFQFSDATVLTYAQLLARGFDIYGTTGDETLTGTNLDNRIYAGSGNDTLIGSGANDTLIAGSGLDTLIGGLGNETFVVNNTADIVIAQANAASNTVLTSVSYVAPANVQTLTGTGTGDITLTGNSLNDVITANSGNDLLIAGSGNDTLISGTGIDTLVGGPGNDTFVVNNASDVIQVAGPGNSITLTGSGGILNSGAASETVYSTGDSETITVGAGSTVTLSGTNSDATVGSNSTVTVNGTGNSVAAGNGSTITLNTGTSTGLSISHGTVDYDGSNIWTSLAGANNTVNVASGVTGDMAIVFGNNNTFNVASAGNRFTLLGSGDVLNSGTAAETVWDYANSTSVTVGDGSTVTVSASNSTATVGRNSTVTLSGTNNSVTAGSGSTITVNAGTGNGLTLTDDTVNVTGNNTSYAIYGSGNMVNTASGATGNLALVIGDDNTLDSVGAGNTFDLLGSGETLNSGTAAETVYSTGGYESITVGSGSTVTLMDFNDNVTVGSNSTVTLNDFNDSVTVGSNSTVTVDGDGDTITAGSGSIITLVSGIGSALTLTDSMLNVTGSDVWSTISGSNDTINLASDVTGNTMNVFGSNNTINVASAGNSFTLQGSGDTLDSGSAAEIVWDYADSTSVTVGGGSIVTLSASNSNVTVGGNSTVIVNNASNLIQFQAGATNTLQTSVSYVAPANVQNLTGIGSADLSLTGNGLANVITANDGNDTLVASTGGDTLIGGMGQNTFVLNSGDGQVTIDDTANAQSAHPGSDVIKFGAGLTVTDVQFQQQGPDVLISDGSQADSFVIKNVELGGVSGTVPIATYQFADGSCSNYADNGQGDYQFTLYDAQSNRIGDQWNHADGSYGSDIFNVDGSSSGNAYNADSSYSSYTNDGQGGIDTSSYDASGVLMSDAWQGSDGSHGTDTYTYSAGALIQTDQITYGISGISGDRSEDFRDLNPDGSLKDERIAFMQIPGSDVQFDDNGDGILDRESWYENGGLMQSYGVDDFNPDGTVKNEIDIFFDESRCAIGAVAGNGTTYHTTLSVVFDPNAAGTTWQNPDGSHGRDTLKADGSSSGIAYSVDGGYTTYADDGQGDLITSSYDSGGILQGNTWQMANSVYGGGTYTYSSGIETRYETFTVDASGNETDRIDDMTPDSGIQSEKIVETSADGNTIFTLWDTNADGFIDRSEASWKTSVFQQYQVSDFNLDSGLMDSTLTVTNPDSHVTWTYSDFNGDGVIDRTETIAADVNGNKTGDTWQNLDGSHGSDTFNIDGSSSGTAYNVDGSYSIYTNDGQSGIDTSSYDASGMVLGNNWLHSDGHQGVDASGNHLLLGTAGADTIGGGTGNDLLIGGGGNDFISLASATNVIAFNRGDGQDIVSASAGQNNTLSLGGNFAYTDLSLQKNGNDLMLDLGSSDAVVFKDWYVSPANQNIVNLQVIDQAMSDYAPGSTDLLRNNSVENFDFQNVVTEFNQAIAADPALSGWSLTNALLDSHLSGSDSAALGGDLAYEYGVRGNLTGFDAAAAEGTLSSSQFATAPQALHPWPALNTGTAQLR
jgi:Ca2+-binding RTX toxin-like protein